MSGRTLTTGTEGHLRGAIGDCRRGGEAAQGRAAREQRTDRAVDHCGHAFEPEYRGLQRPLAGNFYANQRTAEDYRKAIGYYQEAIRLDPRYALAYAKLSVAAQNLALRYGIDGPREVEELIATARASAKRSLELDPNLANAHSARGVTLFTIDCNFVEAEAEFRRALELTPQNAHVTANLAALMLQLGRLDEAVALGQRAIALEPLGGAAHYNFARSL